MGRARHVLIVILLTLCLSATGWSETTGRVFVDLDGDGAAASDEPGREGVRVSNGRDVAISDATGRYRLPAREDGFVRLTRSDGARAETWFRTDGGDFALSPSPNPLRAGATGEAAEDGFFFVHMSDAHAYPRPEDLREAHSPDDIPWWLPRIVVGYYMLRPVVSMYPDLGADAVTDAMRAAAAPHLDLSRSWNATVMLDYAELISRPGVGLIDPEGGLRRSLAEIAALAPRFVVNTGDTIMEGNQAGPAAVERWYRYTSRALSSSGLDVYTTIGNNELAGTENEDFSPDDPRYGKALFQQYYGPTYYSFDQGSFHFVALDTHRPDFAPGEPERWEFEAMEPDVRAWLEADLAAHRDKVLVVLNHEPFHYDPSWGMKRPYGHVDDEGLFEEYGVSYTLSGHIHKNGFSDGDPTTHITTGALSGFRWILPEAIAVRGYRLFYAHGDRLYSAWKQTGRPVLGFITPAGDPGLHPASKAPARADAVDGELTLVAVAADARGPFPRVSLRQGEQTLPLERWGDYFVATRIDTASFTGGRAVLTLEATAHSGVVQRAELALIAAAPASDESPR